MSQQNQNLSPFAKVKAEALRASKPNLSETEIRRAANLAAEQAREEFGRLMEAGADPWTAREQILSDLTNQ